MKIICGAPNVKKDMLTVLAPLVALLIQGQKKNFQLKKVQSGERSQMVCYVLKMNLNWVIIPME